MTSELTAVRSLRANGLPVTKEKQKRHWAIALLRSRWLWIILGATVLYAACLGWMYVTSVTPTPAEGGGEVPGLNLSAIRRSATLALPTLAVWVVAFVALDRFRPMRLGFWYLALGWGAAVSTSLSMVINTWASRQMAIVGADPATGARAAVFVAPFVEEATKATVVFFIAIAVRYRIVSTLQAVTLAGLSAAGFAFTENILYYSRVIVYSSVTIGTGNPEQALNSIVFLRGVKTAFGHPLFTSLMALGFIVGLRAHSKIVRIIAPLVGYLAAALGHMLFNFFASIGADDTMMAIMGWGIALTLVIYLIRRILAEGRRQRDRLGDYVDMGWLPPTVVTLFTRQRTRWACFFISVTHGWRAMLATVRIQRTMSELAYLRDAELHGTVDEAGELRARTLLDEARALAPVAITDPAVQKIQLPQFPAWLRLRRRRTAVGPWAPSSPVPASFLPGTVGSPGYSPVDPRWGPPKG